jgi:hypothetical protein
MMEPIKKALKLAREDKWDEPVELPPGITHLGRSTCSVSSLVDTFHLRDLIGGQDEEDT